jgi:hypothetical protein
MNSLTLRHAQRLNQYILGKGKKVDIEAPDVGERLRRVCERHSNFLTVLFVDRSWEKPPIE